MDFESIDKYFSTYRYRKYISDQNYEDMNNNLLKIIISSVLLVAAMVIEHFLALAEWQLLLIYLVPYIIVAYDVYKEAIEGLLEGELLNEDFLMCIATLGALCIGFLPEAEPEFAEAVFVMLFFQVGELFEDYAEDKSRESISHLMDIRPDYANIEAEDGSLEQDRKSVV